MAPVFGTIGTDILSAWHVSWRGVRACVGASSAAGKIGWSFGVDISLCFVSSQPNHLEGPFGFLRSPEDHHLLCHYLPSCSFAQLALLLLCYCSALISVVVRCPCSLWCFVARAYQYVASS